MAAPTIASAVTKSVTIDWTMSDTTNVTGYKMYYSFSSDMSPRGEPAACETNDPAVTSLTCANVDIPAGKPIYFAIAAITADGELISESKSPISMVQNFSLLTPATR
ncbi:MAG: hypothetical protein MUO63_01600 [Desulfobulbaceae bacterium]|nr:hypothetical protein [Desulfobulbaceae bacterium]